MKILYIDVEEPWRFEIGTRVITDSNRIGYVVEEVSINYRLIQFCSWEDCWGMCPIGSDNLTDQFEIWSTYHLYRTIVQ